MPQDVPVDRAATSSGNWVPGSGRSAFSVNITYEKPLDVSVVSYPPDLPFSRSPPDILICLRSVGTIK